MKATIASILALAAVAFAAPAAPAPVRVPILGEQSLCHLGREHKLTYNVLHSEAASGGSLYVLDKLSGLKNVECDIDGSRLNVHFDNTAHALEYWTLWNVGNAFLVGGGEHGCALSLAAQEAGFLLRHVMGAALNGPTVVVETASAQYDDIYEDAKITLAPTGRGCTVFGDTEECLGVNTADCKNAKGPIPVYSNNLVSVSCDDCFVGVDADVAFDLEIKGFSLKSLSAGLKNVTVNADFDLALSASKPFSAAVDKDLTLVPNTPIIQFSIAGVPFVVYFDVPVEMTADATMLVEAKATAGVFASIAVGDVLLNWTPEAHWTYSTPSPKLSWKLQASGDADFNGDTKFALIPTFELHGNQMFSMSLQLNPDLDVQLQGQADAGTKTGKICEQANYDVSLTARAELKLNIDWLDIHEDKVWGPTELWSKSGQVSSQCFQV